MKLRFLFPLTVMMVFMATCVFPQSQETTDTPKRLTGRVEVGLMGMATTSMTTGLDPDGYIGLSEAFARIDSLNKNRSFEHFGTAFFLFDVNYLLSDTTSAYLGTPFFDDDREGLTTGLQVLFSDSSLLDLALFIGGTDVWKDPYKTGSDRELTQVNSLGFTVDYDGILGTGLHMRYTLRENTVDHDVSGDAEADLRRSGLVHIIKTGYTVFCNDRFDAMLTPTLTYTRHDRDGRANASDIIGLELGYALDRGKNAFSIAGSVEALRFDARHPLFNKTRSERSYSLECFYTRKHLWNKNWYTRLGCGVSRIDSNIGFFDETSVLYGISLGYSFE